MKTLILIDEDTGAVLADRIAHADTFCTRLVGLLGHKSIAAGEGLWIEPSSGVHTFGMRFPIDVVALDRHMRVVRLWEYLPPQRVTSISRRTHSVLELAAGEIRSRSIRVGSRLRVLDRN